MISDFIEAAIARARIEPLSEDGRLYAEIPGVPGVFARGNTPEACTAELREALQAWIFFRISRRLPLPMISPEHGTGTQEDGHAPF